MASGGADLQLWHDWCNAARLNPDRASSADIIAFVAATCHSRSLQYRRAAVVRQHLGHTQPEPVRVQPFDPADHLAGLPRTGWPAGLNRSRDAFILVAASVGLTRKQIQHLTPDDIHTGGARPHIDGRPTPVNPEPGRCAACAVIDWLTLTSATVGGGRGEAQHLLTRHHDAGHRHTLADSRWQDAHQMLPAIDVHGWPDHTRPVSLRTITAALNRPPVRIEPAAEQPAPRNLDATTDELLERLDREAEAAYDKVAAIMRAVGLDPA